MHVTEILGWAGSLLATMGFLMRIVPREYQDYIGDKLLSVFSPYAYFVIPELSGNMQNNEIYVAVNHYISTLASERARISHLLMPKNASRMTFSLADNQRIVDTFEGVRVEWFHKSKERKSALWVGWKYSEDKHTFHLKMHRSDVDFVLNSYLSSIVDGSKDLQRANRDLRIYSNSKMSSTRNKAGWSFTPFKHPASFDTIAIDLQLKDSIVADLEEFTRSEEFYRRVGKPWKRGYLLFGPPGTGKTSIVAAIANKLQYDIYDLELTEVQSNADLRTLLLETTGKSIVLIEDIDCSLNLSGDRKKKMKSKTAAGNSKKADEDDDDSSRVTTSGLLNFTDGLWSAAESERIFIFTTNYIHKLDPALRRPGRMDLQINVGYCSFQAFRTLARNYLAITSHRLFPEVEKLMEGNFLTPAEIAEILTQHKHDADAAVESVAEALRDRRSKPPPAQHPDSADDPNSATDGNDVAEYSQKDPGGAKSSTDQTGPEVKENGS